MRPRTVDDDAILDAAARAVARAGPGRLTLGEVAAEAGLAPATLIQRFGSKRGLLTALSRRSAERAGAELRAERGRRESPLAALRAGLLATAGPVADPQAFANGLAYLQLELADPELHPHVRDYSQAVLDEVAELLALAADAGELRPGTEVAGLARTVQTAYNGALITWAIYRRGSLRRWLGRELDAVIRPHAA